MVGFSDAESKSDCPAAAAQPAAAATLGHSALAPNLSSKGHFQTQRRMEVVPCPPNGDGILLSQSHSRSHIHRMNTHYNSSASPAVLQVISIQA